MAEKIINATAKVLITLGLGGLAYKLVSKGLDKGYSMSGGYGDARFSFSPSPDNKS